MTLPETLGANVTRLINERAGRDDIKRCHIWTTLAREGWPGCAVNRTQACRAAWIKRVAKGEFWPEWRNLEILAAVLEVQPWELLRPQGAGRLGTPAGVALGSL